MLKVWVFCIVVLAVAAINILLKDKDNPDSIGYMLLLIDFNLVGWPLLIMMGRKNNEKKNSTGKK